MGIGTPKESDWGQVNFLNYTQKLFKVS